MKRKHLNQAGFHLLYLLIVVVVVVLIVAVGLRIAAKQDGAKKQQGSSQDGDAKRDDLFVQQYGNNCDDKPTPSFTSSPIATDQVGYIEPMGRVFDGHVTPTDHVYIAPLNPDAADNSYNVVMPADGKVVAIGAMPTSYVGDQNIKTAPQDHRVVISFNCRYYSIFIHIHQLSDKLAQAAGDMQPGGAAKQVTVTLSAGDPIGKIGGSSVDWTMVDINAKLTGFITPKLYESEPWKIHTIDPFSMYAGTLKSQLEAKSLRTEKPIGGKIDYDKPRTLLGNWFKAGTNGYAGANQDRYYDGHLAVMPNHIDVDSVVVSIGNWNGKAAQFAVKGKVNPGGVTKSNSPVKYELLPLGYETPEGASWTGRGFVSGLKVSQRGAVAGTIMFEVQDGEKLRVERFPGKSAGEVTTFTANAEIYQR